MEKTPKQDLSQIMTFKNTTFLFIFFLLMAITFFFLSDQVAKDCLIIRNSKYFDGDSSVYVSNKTIVIRKDKITEILGNENLQQIDILKNACNSVDLSGKYLFPGLIDSHTHLLAVDAQRVTDWKVALEKSAARPNMTRLFLGEKNARSMLLAGFTTLRDLGNSGNFLDFDLRTRSLNAPEFFPDIIISGPGIAVAPTQINLRTNSAEYRVINEASEIDGILAEYKKRNVPWIKLYADNSNHSVGIGKSLLRTLTSRAHELKMKVAVHAIYKESVANALNSDSDSIEHFDEVPGSDLPKFKRMPFVITTDFTLETCERIPLDRICVAKLNLLRTRLRWLQNNGFPLVFGSDSVLDFSSNFKSRGQASLASLTNLTQMGLSPAEAITSATSTAAEMLGLKIGKIQETYTANLVAYKEDPLKDLNNLKIRTLVISRGFIICKSSNECRP